MKRKFLAVLFCLFLLCAFMIGCQSENRKTETSDKIETQKEMETSNETSYPISINHYFGKTIIEKKPERIVTLGWENQDTPLALGIAPVGCSAANYGHVTKNKLHV